MEKINKEDLKDLYLYEILARNGNFGIYIKERNSFLLMREKFGFVYPFEEYHVDNSFHGTVRLMKEIEKSPFTLEDVTMKEFPDENGKTYLSYKEHAKILVYLNKFEQEYQNCEKTPK